MLKKTRSHAHKHTLAHAHAHSRINTILLNNFPIRNRRILRAIIMLFLHNNFRLKIFC